MPNVMNVVGIPPVTVWVPCSTCNHPHDQHGPGGTLCNAMVEGEEGQMRCPCQEFTGSLEDGSPRGFQARQMTPLEWAALGEGVPVNNGTEGEKENDFNKAKASYERMRRIVIHAVTHVRYHDPDSGETRWQPCKVVEKSADNENWEIGIDQLDVSVDGINYVGLIAGTVLDYFNNGGRPANRARFQRRGTDPVPQPGG